MAPPSADAGPAAAQPIAATGWSGWTRASAALARVTGCIAAVMVIVEVITLLATIIARYLLHSPLTWGDEFAGSVFLWLSMLGAVIALERGEHMRFGAVVQGLGPTRRIWLDILGVVVIAALLLQLVGPAWDYVEDEWFTILPALGFRSAYRVVGIEGGLVLMLVTLALQALRRGQARITIAAVAVVAAAGAALWFCRRP